MLGRGLRSADNFHTLQRRFNIMVPLLFLSVYSAVVCVSSSPEVKESSAPYSCCESHTFKFDQSCKNTLTINEQPIAYSDNVSRLCHPPCQKIEDGLMTLDKCVNASLTTVCHNSKGQIEEKRTYYLVQPCSRTASNGMAAGNQGSVGLLLLAVVISGWSVKLMIC